MSEDGITLRRFELGDLAQVTRIEKESFPDHPYGRLEFLYYMVTCREGFIVASSEDGSLVGYVIAQVQGREASIQSVAVSSAYRRRGIGELLMGDALRYLSGSCSTVRLLVGVNNEPAIGLYHGLSFTETGKVVRRYYPNGDDAIEMERRL